MSKLITAILLIIFFGATPILAETRTWFCSFPQYSDKAGLHQTKDKFVLTFIVDSDNDTAYIVGNLGSSKVDFLSSEGGFTFIEITPAGNVMTTTVDTKSHAVHSRNTVIYGELVPTQYYGTCEVK